MLNIDDFLFGGEYYLSPYAPAQPLAFNDVSASRLVAQIKAGWNLGNTLDAYPGGETSWGNPVTTRENIDAIKNAGFNAVRIPVSWHKNPAMNASTYEIKKEWMDRVTEVVNYAAANDLYIILNSHHDEEIFKFTQEQREESLAAFYRVWSQIAYNFRNYNEKLIFEALNEPRTKGSPGEWTGGSYPEYLILNEHYELFVKIVRASGGNNDRRAIMVTPYAASAEQTALNGLVIPEDTAPEKIIISIHSYTPYNFALNQGTGAVDKWSRDNSRDTSSITSMFDRAEAAFISKGYPVIMGEFGAVDRNNNAARIEWIEYYVSYARSKGIPCIIWDNGLFDRPGEKFGFLDRHTNTFPYPGYLEAFLRGAGVR